MKVFDAIKEMRILSEKKIPFSFSFMSFSMEKQSSQGIVRVNHGEFKRRDTQKTNKYSEHMQSYVDLDTGEYKRFWQCLLIEFNGIKTEL
jgi:hypothetical protein